MIKILTLIRKRLYFFVLIDFLIAIFAGKIFHLSNVNIKPISILAVYLMLYPMLTGMEIEKVKEAAKDYKLITSTLFFAFFIASLNAYILANTIFKNYPELALGLLLVGAIPCSNMLIGWSGIAGAKVENALVIAVIGLLSIPFISPILIKLTGNKFVDINTIKIFSSLLLFIIVPLVLGYITRKLIINKKGIEYFKKLKTVLPGFSATGVLLIIFVSVAKISDRIINHPIMFLKVGGTLFLYFIIQTIISVIFAKLMKFSYDKAMILILGATASSQAISLSLAATNFGGLTVFVLSFKPILQVGYILFLIYYLGPKIKIFLQ